MASPRNDNLRSPCPPRLNLSKLRQIGVTKHEANVRMSGNSVQFYTDLIGQKAHVYRGPIEASRLRRRAFDLLKKRQIPFYPQLRRTPAT
jgi:hypothetical protein